MKLKWELNFVTRILDILHSQKIKIQCALYDIWHKLFKGSNCYMLLLIRISYFMVGGIEKFVMMDTSYDMVKLCKSAEQDAPNENIETSFMVGDEEFLPIKER